MKKGKKLTSQVNSKKSPSEKGARDQKGVSALLAFSMGISATAQAHLHSNTGISSNNNISYGGAKTHDRAGKDMKTAMMMSNSDYEQNNGGFPVIHKQTEGEKGEYWDEYMNFYTYKGL